MVKWVICKKYQNIWASFPNPFKERLTAKQWKTVLNHNRECKICQVNNIKLVEMFEELLGKSLKSELGDILP